MERSGSIPALQRKRRRREMSERTTKPAALSGRQEPKESAPEVLKAENLVKCFDTLTAVDEVSFSVHRGEIFGFLGPNGAGTTSMLAVTISFERRSRSFQRLLLAPINLSLLMLAKTGGAILFGVLNAFFPLLVAAFVVDLWRVDWIGVIGSILLIACTSAFLGLFISVAVQEVFEAQTFSHFFRFPMLFLCGLFVPIARLPAFLRPCPICFP